VANGRVVHEFEPGAKDKYIKTSCLACGEYEDSPVHYHEFRLAFGEFYCAICLEKVDAPQHKGVNMEGITERPVREVEPLKSNEEFWDEVQAAERMDKKRVFFPTFGSSTTAGKISIEEDQESVDTLISRANPEVFFDSSEKVLIKDKPQNPHSFFTKGDRIVVGGLCLVGVGNTILGIYSLLH
jgi:hypothetical protein